jgi:exodeoxyribonuclease VII small subunit
MQPDINDLTFEAALQELEETVARLEAGNFTLEEAMQLFERGQQLVRHCNQHLDQAVLRVEQLTADGEIIEVE